MDHHEPQSRRFAPYQRKSLKNRSKLLTHAIEDQQPWTQEEDELLRTAVYKHGGKKWKTIATFLDKRTPAQCNARWSELQNHGTAVKKPWSSAEDMQMLELVKSYGAGKWAVIASYLPGRNGKQCRERWHNQLNPAIKKSPWTPEEDAIILEMQRKYGNCWAKITEKLTGRTDNAVKNHWHSSMKGKLQPQQLSHTPSPSSSNSTFAASVSGRAAAARRRTSTKVADSRTRSRSNRRSAHIPQGSSSPDCVAAVAHEFDTQSAAYDDFTNFVLHDPVAPELFDLPRHVFEDVTDPLGFMRDHVLMAWSVPQLHELRDDKCSSMTQSTDKCIDAPSRFGEMPLTSASSETLAATGCAIDSDAVETCALSTAFDDDEGMSSVTTSTEDTYSDAVLSSLDDLCSSEDDSSSCCSFVKDELPLLESPECSPAPLDGDMLGMLPLSPPYTASGTDDEQFRAALFSWDHHLPGLHPLELQAAQPSPFGSVEMGVDDENLDALSGPHAGSLALVCDADIDDAMSAQQRDAGLDASLNCLSEDIDALVTHLSV